jgi:hypothetical protein
MRSEDLLRAYDELDMELYLKLSDSLTSINKFSINDDIVNHSRIYSYYAGLMEYASFQVKQYENELEKYQVDLKNDARDAIIHAGARATVAAVEDYVGRDTTLHTMKKNLEEKRYKQGLLKSLVQSMSHRKDLLVQLSANSRAETRMITD